MRSAGARIESAGRKYRPARAPCDMMSRFAAPSGILRNYSFRDQQGLEVDFLIPRPNARFWAVEVKSSRTPQPWMAGPLRSLFRAADDRAVRRIVVHRGARMQTPLKALVPGVEALTLEQFVAEINGGKAV